MADSDSSYRRVIFPVKKENMRICLSGNEKVTKCDESGDSVMQVGMDFDCKQMNVEQVDA